MPYITQNEREYLKIYHKPKTAGQLNYLITRLCLKYAQPLKYQKIAEVTGVLENVKQEFYRRFAAPYEDAKMSENGDVTYEWHKTSESSRVDEATLDNPSSRDSTTITISATGSSGTTYL